MTLTLRGALPFPKPYSLLPVRCRVAQALAASEPGPVEQR
jgi:hypothetical protein